jgi:hypothetical protein
MEKTAGRSAARESRKRPRTGGFPERATGEKQPHRKGKRRARNRREADGTMQGIMNPLLLIIILLLLFGGGGFYWGGPVYGGSAIGLILVICIIMLLMGAFGSRK